MTSFSLKFFLILNLTSYLYNVSFAQTTMSGGIGLSFLDINSENSLENSNTYIGGIFLKDSNNDSFNLPTLTGRLRIDRKLAERFSASYHFKIFIKTLDVDYVYEQAYPPITGYKGTTQIISTVHAGTVNFSLVEKVKFGVGGFYQMTKPSTFTLFSFNNNNSARPFHQAGALLSADLSVKKWTFQFNYLKSLGNILILGIADSIDSIGLSALYQFHTFKTKKERKIHRQQKGE